MLLSSFDLRQAFAFSIMISSLHLNFIINVECSKLWEKIMKKMLTIEIKLTENVNFIRLALDVVRNRNKSK